MQTLTRHRHWEVRLATWGTEMLGRPMVWGETDCHALVRSALEVMYGEDLFPDVPRWSSKAEARHRISNGEDIVTTLEAHGAFRLPSPLDVAIGDIVVEPRGRTFWRPTWVVVGGLLLTGEPRVREVVGMRRPVQFAPGALGLRVTHG